MAEMGDGSICWSQTFRALKSISDAVPKAKTSTGYIIHSSVVDSAPLAVRIVYLRCVRVRAQWIGAILSIEWNEQDAAENNRLSKGPSEEMLSALAEDAENEATMH